MRRFIFNTAMLAGCFAAAAGNTPEAYRLFDNSGREVTFDQMTDSLSRADVVFIGENHNCPISHWMELEITRAMHNIHGRALTLGEEMMEADNQLLLDEYLTRKIDYDRFEAEARLWDNYQTDYYPVVFYAKDNGIPFVATNIPRRYASVVKNKGLEALDSLSDEARRYIAPLPIPFLFDKEKSNEAFGMMQALGGRTSGDMERLAQAQAVKDATMAWFISRNIGDGRFIHINGSYHSDNRDGIIPYLLRYRPGTRVATVTSVRQERIDALDPENMGRADFYIAVPEDFPTSY
ncbi:MAG: ChaN family lipoprotein [Muribaculaceae bacterium]|nr:ChaN family lipoprotein [Muribaculaceae bacterium]